MNMNNDNSNAIVSKPICFCTPTQARALLFEGRMLLMLVRHGMTDWNAQMRLQGRADIPLNEAGHEQAKRLAEVFSAASEKIDICEVYTSPLHRAKDTAEYISKELLGRCPVVKGELIERNYSSLEGLTLAERKKAFPHPSVYPTDIEDVTASAVRIKRIALDIFRRAELTEGKVCAAIGVTHGGVMNALFSYLTRARAGTCRNLSANCSIALLASGEHDIIPLAFNLMGNDLIEYVNELS